MAEPPEAEAVPQEFGQILRFWGWPVWPQSGSEVEPVPLAVWFSPPPPGEPVRQGRVHQQDKAVEGRSPEHSLKNYVPCHRSYDKRGGRDSA